MLWRRGKAYSQDLRERILAATDDGVPVSRIAALLRVCVSYVSKVLSRRRRTGQTTARPQRCQMTPKLGDLHAAIPAQVGQVLMSASAGTPRQEKDGTVSVGVA
jgi:transposase